MDLVRRGRGMSSSPCGSSTAGRRSCRARPSRRGQARGRHADGHASRCTWAPLSRGRQRDPAVVLAAAAETAALLLDPLDLPDGLDRDQPEPQPCTSFRGHCCRACTTDRSSSPRRPVSGGGAGRAGRRSRGTPSWSAAPDLSSAEAEGRRRRRLLCRRHAARGRRERRSAPSPRRCAVSTSPTSCATEASPSENPMFSSLRLADGPMFVYDLERLSPPPHRGRAVGLLGGSSTPRRPARRSSASPRHCWRPDRGP